MNGSGKCMIKFTYRRILGRWWLVKNKIDSEARGVLGQKFFWRLYWVLLKAPMEDRPYQHEKIILKALSELRMDHGVQRKLGGDYGKANQTHQISIEIRERSEQIKYGIINS